MKRTVFLGTPESTPYVGAQSQDTDPSCGNTYVGCHEGSVRRDRLTGRNEPIESYRIPSRNDIAQRDERGVNPLQKAP